MIPLKYKSVERIPQTELQDLHGTFYIHLIEQLQSLLYVLRMNGAQTVRKTKLDHHLGYFLFHCCGVSLQVLSSEIMANPSST